MNKIENGANLDALQYNEGHREKVNGICLSLFKSFAITYFAYLRLYPSGRLLRLCTHTPWSREYFEQEFYNDTEFYDYHFKRTPKGRGQAFLWIAQKETNLYSSLQKNNIWNGLSIYKRSGSYMESCSFGTIPENRALNSTFINKKQVFYDFLDHFKYQADELIHPLETAAFIQSGLEICDETQTNSKNVETFLDAIGSSRTRLRKV